jgi:hypothetical protein
VGLGAKRVRIIYVAYVAPEKGVILLEARPHERPKIRRHVKPSLPDRRAIGANSELITGLTNDNRRAPHSCMTTKIA